MLSELIEINLKEINIYKIGHTGFLSRKLIDIIES